MTVYNGYITVLWHIMLYNSYIIELLYNSYMTVYNCYITVVTVI